MKRKQFAIIVAVALSLLVLTAGVVVLAQTSAGFNLEWNVIGGGGGASGSASYQVNGTIGQSAASPPDSNSASFSVSSGYWVAGTETRLFLPVVVKN